MSALTDRVDELFAAWDKPGSPGCALGVVQDGKLVYKNAYGMADLERNVRLSPRSVFDIASTSKQFAATCIALLAEQGKLSLDDALCRHVPEMPEYEHTITIRHLVHHTSGICQFSGFNARAGCVKTHGLQKGRLSQVRMSERWKRGRPSWAV